MRWTLSEGQQGPPPRTHDAHWNCCEMRISYYIFLKRNVPRRPTLASVPFWDSSPFPEASLSLHWPAGCAHRQPQPQHKAWAEFGPVQLMSKMGICGTKWVFQTHFLTPLKHCFPSAGSPSCLGSADPTCIKALPGTGISTRTPEKPRCGLSQMYSCASWPPAPPRNPLLPVIPGKGRRASFPRMAQPVAGSPGAGLSGTGDCPE